MIYKIYSVFDSKVGSYLSPFFMRSKGEAIRALQGELTNEQSNICKYPSDFTLFEIGEYDDSKGMISPITPLSVGAAVEFLEDVSRIPVDPKFDAESRN